MSLSVLHAHLTSPYKLPYISPKQFEALETVFQNNKNPQVSDLVILAAEVGLPISSVKVWFENRLAYWRQTQGLPANWRHVRDYKA